MSHVVPGYLSQPQLWIAGHEKSEAAPRWMNCPLLGAAKSYFPTTITLPRNSACTGFSPLPDL